MEKLLDLLPHEDKMPVVKPHQVRRTGVTVIDIGASSDILGADVAEQPYNDYIRPTGRQLEFSIANQKQVFPQMVYACNWQTGTFQLMLLQCRTLLNYSRSANDASMPATRSYG